MAADAHTVPPLQATAATSRTSSIFAASQIAPRCLGFFMRILLSSGGATGHSREYHNEGASKTCSSGVKKLN